jgi:hypothetical protein
VAEESRSRPLSPISDLPADHVGRQDAPSALEVTVKRRVPRDWAVFSPSIARIQPWSFGRDRRRSNAILITTWMAEGIADCPFLRLTQGFSFARLMVQAKSYSVHYVSPPVRSLRFASAKFSDLKDSKEFSGVAGIPPDLTVRDGSQIWKGSDSQSAETSIHCLRKPR